MDKIKDIKIDVDALLSWFSGKGRKDAELAMAMLLDSRNQGYWVKGASRRVRAALGKANVARKGARSARRFYEAAPFEHDEKKPNYRNAWFTVYMALECGHPDPERVLGAIKALDEPAAREILPDDLPKGSLSPAAERTRLLDVAARFALDFAGVKSLCAALDARRPARMVVMGTLSPTVAATLGDERLKLDASTLRSPPTKYEWVEVTLKDGTTAQRQMIVIDWPPGTRFNRSRFRYSDRNRLCQACGHAIKDPLNWVPVLIDGRVPEVRVHGAGMEAAEVAVPHCFLVGSDCARKLFGCTVEGEAEYANLMPEGE